MIEASVMKTTYLAGGLTDGQLAALGALAELKSFTSGTVLAKVGEPASEMFLILSGEVVVTTADNDRLASIKAGEVVGEVALVDDQPRAANVVCVGPVTAGVFSIKAFRQAIMADKDAGLMIMANVARLLALRLRKSNALVDVLSSKANDAWSHAAG